MSEQEKNLYNLEQAQAEAEKVQEKAGEIAGGENVRGEDYKEAGWDVDLLIAEKQEEMKKALSERRLDSVEKIINFADKNNIRLEIAQACQKRLETALRERIRYAKEIIIFANQNNIELDLKKPEITQACQKGFAAYLSLGLFVDYKKYIIDFFKNNNIEIDLKKSEIAKACQKGLETSLSDGRYYVAIEIIDFCNDNNIKIDSNRTEVVQSCQEGLEKSFDGRVVSSYEKIINFAKKNNIELKIVHACKKGLESLFDVQYNRDISNDGTEIINFIEMYNIKIDISKFFQKGVEVFLSNGLIDRVRRVIGFVKRNNMWEDNDNDIEINLNRPEIIQACQKGLEMFLSKKGQSFDEIIDFAKENSIKLNKKSCIDLIEAGEEKFVDENIDLFQGEFFDKCKEFNLYPSEAYYINDFDKIDNLNDFKKEQCQDWFNKLKENHKIWQDQENISGPFEAGGEHFGYDKMFKYIGQEDRHDVLYNFDKITELAKESGLKLEQFYGQILNQVKMDDAQYGGEEEYDEEDEEYYETSIDSYQYLNNIADAVNVEEIENILQKAEKYKDIDKLQKLVRGFFKKENVFEDWKSLKKYYELTQILGKAELLDQLKELKKQGKDELYNYIETLAFHPNIDMQKVMQFWQEPERFLDIGEIHAEESHKRKKPSNYTEFPHLDLTAENLRDGLVEGDLDKLQDWQPLEVEYQLPENLSSKPKTLQYYLAKNIGVSDKEIRQTVGIKQDEKLKRNGKLFSSLTKRFKAEKLDLVKYLKGEQKIPEKMEQELEQFRGGEQAPTVEYRAKINLKSDPDGVVAGNDTACCMPFGSGKNNVYTYNPVCALFTVQKKAGNKWRTVAQSVLTKDIDIKKNISEIISQIENEKVKLDSLVDEDVLIQSEQIITADNIEVAPNFKENQDKDKILEYIYTDFFQEYIKQFGKQEKLDKKRAVIGKGYTDAMTNLNSIDNTFVPLAPVGYSDNLGKTALELKLDSEQEKMALKRKVSAREKPQRNDLVKSKIKGIENLTFKDSLQVSFLESKAYADNETLMEYMHNMENGLIAKDINNVSKERSNLSLKYVDDKKRMQGYILAYEGKSDGEEVIYISDLASNPKAKMTGGRLIKGFAEIYKEHYLDKNNFMPILAEAREKTSYAIIIKQLDKIGEQLGIKFKMEELEKKEKGGDTMHLVLIKPKK